MTRHGQVLFRHSRPADSVLSHPQSFTPPTPHRERAPAPSRPPLPHERPNQASFTVLERTKPSFLTETGHDINLPKRPNTHSEINPARRTDASDTAARCPPTAHRNPHRSHNAPPPTPLCVYSPSHPQAQPLREAGERRPGNEPACKVPLKGGRPAGSAVSIDQLG